METSEVKRICSQLKNNDDADQILDLLGILQDFVITHEILTTTPLARIVGKLRKHHHEVIKSRAINLVKKWKDAIPQIESKSVVSREAHSPKKRAVQVCILVPKPRTANRKIYESLPIDPAQRRQDWFAKCIGADGIYVGRPKCDGGWYHVPEVKQGSCFANPFSLKEYSLAKSLELFTEYLHARIHPNATVENLIPLFPENLHRFLRKRFVEGKQNEGKSVSHYNLFCCGDPFRKRLMDLRGRRLACWCDSPKLCHAGVLADFVNAATASSTPSSTCIPSGRQVSLEPPNGDSQTV